MMFIMYLWIESVCICVYVDAMQRNTRTKT